MISAASTEVCVLLSAVLVRPFIHSFVAQSEDNADWTLCAECLQEDAVEAAITVMVFGHFSRPDVAAVYCRRPGLSSHCGTSLEGSV